MSSAPSRPSKLSAGGLFQLVQRWMRGPESRDFPIPVQIAIAVMLLWLPLVVLSALDGHLVGEVVEQPLLSDLVPHVRLLVAIPLLLLADLVIDPVTGLAIRHLETSGLVPDREHTRFQAARDALKRARESVWPDVIIVALAFGFVWQFKAGYGDSAVETLPTTWLWNTREGELFFTPAGWWYLLVSGPMFQVILFRWVWRFIIWGGFLFRVSRLALNLRPTHPDLAGGLGHLGTAQASFVVVFLAFATVASSTIAHDIIAEGQAFMDARLEIAALVVVFVAVIYAPLLFFTRQLYQARCSGLEAYGSLALGLSEAFQTKWIRGDTSGIGKDLLTSTDPSAMADYSATYENVRSMRLMPTSLRGVALVTGMLLIPFVPLTLTEFSIQDLLTRLTGALV